MIRGCVAMFGCAFAVVGLLGCGDDETTTTTGAAMTCSTQTAKLNECMTLTSGESGIICYCEEFYTNGDLCKTPIAGPEFTCGSPGNETCLAPFKDWADEFKVCSDTDYPCLCQAYKNYNNTVGSDADCTALIYQAVDL